jgi:hypothetical protein
MMELPKRHATSESSLYGQLAHVNASGVQKPSEIRKAQAGGTPSRATYAMSIVELGISARCQLSGLWPLCCRCHFKLRAEYSRDPDVKVLEIKATLSSHRRGPGQQVRSGQIYYSAEV